MSPRASEFDIINTVSLDDSSAVAEAACRVLRQGFGALGAAEEFLRRAFGDVEMAFWGRYPGLLHCDTPYHDLRHSLDTALLVARMADGWQKSCGSGPPLSARDAVLAVFLALFHDIGFIRRTGERHLVGAQLLRQHEARSVEFVGQYLAATRYADHAGWADLIQATNLAVRLADLMAAWPRPDRAVAGVVGRLIGSADLISQMADRSYLERCCNHLYREFFDAGADRANTPNGDTVLIYRDGVDLLEKTPGFYENLVRRRLEDDFGGIDGVIAKHFAGFDPYRESIERNMSYLTRLIAEGALADGLRRHPIPLMPT